MTRAGRTASIRTASAGSSLMSVVVGPASTDASSTTSATVAPGRARGREPDPARGTIATDDAERRFVPRPVRRPTPGSVPTRPPSVDVARAVRARGERGGGTTTRPAGRSLAVPRVASCAEHHVVGEGGPAEGGRVRLPDDDGACGAQASDDGRVRFGGRRAGVQLRAERRREAGDVGEVLDEQRYPRQRPTASGRIQGVGLGEGVVGADEHHRVQIAVGSLDAPQ